LHALEAGQPQIEKPAEATLPESAGASGSALESAQRGIAEQTVAVAADAAVATNPGGVAGDAVRAEADAAAEKIVPGVDLIAGFQYVIAVAVVVVVVAADGWGRWLVCWEVGQLGGRFVGWLICVYSKRYHDVDVFCCWMVSWLLCV